MYPTAVATPIPGDDPGILLVVAAVALVICVLGAIADRIERADPRWPE